MSDFRAKAVERILNPLPEEGALPQETDAINKESEEIIRLVKLGYLSEAQEQIRHTFYLQPYEASEVLEEIYQRVN